MRSMIPGASCRVVLLRLPPDPHLDRLGEMLRQRDHSPEEVARMLGALPAVVATHLTRDQAQHLVRELTELGAEAELVDATAGAASLDPAAARTQRDEKRKAQRSRGGFMALALVGVGAALFLTPTTLRQHFAPEAGSTMRFEQFLDIEQKVSRGADAFAAKGTWQWTLERDVLSATDDEIVVRDHIRNPVHNLRVVGASAQRYRDQLRSLTGLMASTPFEHRFDGDGKIVKYADVSALLRLDPYPDAFMRIFDRLHFPPNRVKMGETWVVPLTETRGISITLEALEEHLGVATSRVSFESGSTFEGVEDQSSSSPTQQSLDASGVAWIARDTGWVIEAELEIERSYSSVVAVHVSEDFEISARHRWLGASSAANVPP